MPRISVTLNRYTGSQPRGVLINALTLLLLFAAFFALLPAQPTYAQENVWRLTEAIINPHNEKLEFYGGGTDPTYYSEARYKGKYVKYTVTETSFSIEDRWVDNNEEWYHINMHYTFDAPPEVLVPGESYPLKMNFSHSGSVTKGNPGTVFAYSSPSMAIGSEIPLPDNAFRNYPWAQVPSDVSSMTWILNPPSIGAASIEAGATLEIYVYGGAPACKVKWVYTAESAVPDATPTTSGTRREDARTRIFTDPSDNRPDWVKRSEEHFNSAEEIYVPDWLEWMKPKRSGKNQGTLLPRGSEGVWVYDHLFKKWRGPIHGEKRLNSGDMVSTGPQSDCWVVFSDTEGRQDTFAVGRNTLLGIPNDEESKWPTLWSLYEGAVRIKRALLREASIPKDLNPLLMRTPKVVCGIADRPRLFRFTFDTPQVLLVGLAPSFGQYAGGNRVVEEEWVEIVDFIVAHDQETKTSVIYVISGALDYYNMAAAGPDDAVITAGQKLSVTKDGIETIITFNSTELDSFEAKYHLEQPVIRSKDELEALFSKAENGAASGFPVLAVVIGIIVIIASGAIFILIRVRKK